MKCKICDQEIVIHDNLLTKTYKPLTMEVLEYKGMIYSKDGLIEYSNSSTCEVCTDEQTLDTKKLRSYRLRIVKENN